MPGVEDGWQLDVEPSSVSLPLGHRLTFHTMPLPIRPRLCLENAAFAHPFEADFARLLDFYRIPWAYEPTSFPLAWDGSGKPVVLCTPDFYLPEQQLYIELTTVRQRLVTRKHRKVRLLRAVYPNVRVRLLYRRDYERLLQSYRHEGEGQDDERPGPALYGPEALDVRIAELASSIAHAYGVGDASRPLLLLGVEPGVTVFQERLGAALDRLGIPHEHDQIALAPFPGGADHGCRVTVRRRPALDPRGRRVLLLMGVVSTGLSLDYLLRWLYRRRPVLIEVCALFDRRSARVADVTVRYVGFEAPNEVLVGYGLNRRRQFRGLPFIARLERDD